MHSKGIEFFIRASNHEFMWENINDVHYWKPIRYGNDHLEIAEFDFYPFVQDKTLLGTHIAKHAHRFTKHRIVVTRRPHSKGEINKSTGDAYVYRAIITNNWAMEKEAVLREYNERGDY